MNRSLNKDLWFLPLYRLLDSLSINSLALADRSYPHIVHYYTALGEPETELTLVRLAEHLLIISVFRFFNHY
jgi:hypothetical protein